MLHRINLRSLLTTGVIVGVAAAGTVATTRNWSAGPFQSIRAALTDTGLPAEPAVATAHAPQQAVARRDGVGTANGALERVIPGLPPLFAAIDRTDEHSSGNSARSEGGRGHAFAFGSQRLRQTANTNRSRAARSFGVLSAGGGGGGGGVAARNSARNNNGAIPARPSSGSSGGSSAGGGGAAPGMFGEQNTPIGALAGTPAGLLGAIPGGVGSIGSSVNDLASTPEPGSLLLIGTGLVGLVGALRRRLV